MLGVWKARTSKEKLFCFLEQTKEDKGLSFNKRDTSTKGDHSIFNKQSSFDVCLMNTNIRIVQDDPKFWFIDSGATRHVCGNKYF